jgi:hypothetical protein
VSTVKFETLTPLIVIRLPKNVKTLIVKNYALKFFKALKYANFCNITRYLLPSLTVKNGKVPERKKCYNGENFEPSFEF